MYREDKIIDWNPDLSSSKMVLSMQSCVSDLCQNVIHLCQNVLLALNGSITVTKYQDRIYYVSCNQTLNNNQTYTNDEMLSEFVINEIQNRLDDVLAHIDEIENSEFFCLIPNKLLYKVKDALNILRDMFLVCKNNIMNRVDQPLSSILFGPLVRYNILDLCCKCHMALKQISIAIKQQKIQKKESKYVLNHFIRTGKALSLCIQGCLFLRGEKQHDISAKWLEYWAHMIMISFARLPYPMILIVINRLSSWLALVDFDRSRDELYGGMVQELKKIFFLIESKKLIMSSKLAALCTQIQQKKNVSKHSIIHKYSMIEHFMVYALKIWNSMKFNYREIKWNRKTYHRHVASVIRQANRVGNIIEQWQIDRPDYLLQAGYLMRIINQKF